jgi:hypothetical protein
MPYALRLHVETCTPDCICIDYWLKADGTYTTDKTKARCFRDQNQAKDVIDTSTDRLKMEDW